MSDSGSDAYCPLKPLHVELSVVKLAELGQISTDVLLQTLLPGREGCLKVRPDRTMLDGHHRIHILRGRGVDVERLPREIILKEDA